MIVYKLYYQNLLEISPKLLAEFQVFYARPEATAFAVFIKLGNNISKHRLLAKLASKDIPLPFYIYIIDTRNRKKCNLFTLNKRNVNRIKEILNKDK